jgi:PAS domain S-box-containing protein
MPMNESRVLIITDDPALVELGKMLNVMGYDILTSSPSGIEAERIAAPHGPDIVLLDTAVYGPEGTAVPATVAGIGDLPVVCITRPENEDVLNRIKSAHVYGCLTTPVRERELEIALRIALLRHDHDRRMRKSEEELRKYRVHLEAVISRRTAELKKSNAHLSRLLHFIELTERKLATDALDADMHGDHRVRTGVDEGIITVDPDMRIVIVNSAAQRLLGWTEDESVGRLITDVFLSSDAGIGSRFAASVKSMISSGSPGEALEDIPVRPKAGEVLSCSAYIEPIFDLDDKTAGVVLTFRDSKENRKEEHAAVRSRNMESLNLMVHGLAHDFNNILSSVLANVQLAKVELREGSHSRDRLSSAEEGVLRARELSQQMLTFSGGEMSHGMVTDLNLLIEKTGMFSVRGSGSKCSFTLPPDLWEVPLEEDTMRGMLNDIFLFLDGLQPGGGSIDVAAENIPAGSGESKDLRPVDYVKIRFHIAGHVIPEAVLGEIFRPGSSHAFALDLSLTESLIKKSGGMLGVQSTATGTEIALYLPARVRAAPLAKKEGAIPKGEDTGGRRILLMDDEDAILSATSEMLKFLGYEVAVAHNGEEAIDLYRDRQCSGTPFNAVILDITVPGALGAQETLPKLVALDPGVNAIISSGYSTSPMILDHRSFGYVAAIVKPYGFKELGEALDKVFR